MLTVKEYIEKTGYEVINIGDDSKEITDVFCCDLLSIAMAKAPASSVWVTVMGNVNTLAVSVLTDVSCVVLAEGITLDEAASAQAKKQEITVLRTEQPVFHAALQANEYING